MTGTGERAGKKKGQNNTQEGPESNQYDLGEALSLERVRGYRGKEAKRAESNLTNPVAREQMDHDRDRSGFQTRTSRRLAASR